MSLYGNNPVVVIDDDIYDLMGSYKKVFCKKEYGSSLEGVTWIKLSDAPKKILSENVDDHGVYFYIFNKIDTGNEYVKACEHIITSPNIDVVMIFGQYSRRFDVCSVKSAENPCDIHNIGVIYSFDINQPRLPEETENYRNCLHLMAVLLYLLSFEEGAFADFSVRLKLNYPSMYAAVQKCLFELKDEINKIEDLEEKATDQIEKLEKEGSYRYKIGFSNEGDKKSVPPVPQVDKDLDKSLTQLSSYYLQSRDKFEKRVFEDICLTRNTMAEMDEFAGSGNVIDGKKPDVYQSRTEEKEKITTDDDLLRKVAPENEDKMNIGLAISYAKNLVGTKKPEFAPFVTAGIVALLAFVVTVITVYGVHIIKNTANAVDMNLLAICIAVPVGLIILSVFIGFISNLVAFSSVKKIISDIYDVICKRTDDFESISGKIRSYLNDFITVFCNYHVKDSIIFQCRRSLEIFARSKENILSEAEPINAIADFMEIVYEYEKEAEQSDHDEVITDTMYGNEDSFVDYEETPDYEESSDDDDDWNFTVEDRNASASLLSYDTDGEMKKYTNAKACSEAVEKNSRTTVKGTRDDSFVNSKSPWILQVDISSCVNGGVA